MLILNGICLVKRLEKPQLERLAFSQIHSQILATFLGISSSLALELLILLICFCIITTSAYLGITKGIKRLSNINIGLLTLLLLFILIAGPSAYIVLNSIDVLITYGQRFIQMSTYIGDQFVQDWTVFYWAW